MKSYPRRLIGGAAIVGGISLATLGFSGVANAAPPPPPPPGPGPAPCAPFQPCPPPPPGPPGPGPGFGHPGGPGHR
ncbi:hypothetical protein FR943_06075 [Mycobacterium sp. TNTM28]|uniref:Chitin-binding protein n=1 Tax=[Mycobacterium] fortunisiensis TaxID=2600579 RepID=A0ABS6KIJ8_9MYCO|nr:hypothetical protein [[Mycobacterium] fortunisiensis]